MSLVFLIASAAQTQSTALVVLLNIRGGCTTRCSSCTQYTQSLRAVPTTPPLKLLQSIRYSTQTRTEHIKGQRNSTHPPMPQQRCDQVKSMSMCDPFLEATYCAANLNFKEIKSCYKDHEYWQNISFLIFKILFLKKSLHLISKPDSVFHYLT